MPRTAEAPEREAAWGSDAAKICKAILRAKAERFALPLKEVKHWRVTGDDSLGPARGARREHDIGWRIRVACGQS
jgi:hypothetical protein